ncbi:uncharacterized protein LOC110833998 [Zootermopsis nevadensis]|uniref:LAS1-like protein n=1 Tax=Zootermopsis nevadensis TaxID=136037 RepID=A0A067QZQ9_ZOONE|nr:uncharacterized protein LOC110833998 [Zootermopsis nevadensis]KDR15016.1 LAS1-like protein [Zootermopsis nevadensis]
MELHRDTTLNTRFVPWFNMSEWDEAYKQIYSDDTVAQVKGFERLLVWKARCPQGIPTGAQCTLDLIQICLKDREVWPQIANGLMPPYHEHELQLMYAMAVLRYLNHLATLAKNKIQSLYNMAARLHIPDWIVNIRHDTSHNHNLPSLTILREAAHFCLDWIHEHYWKNEAEMTTDWIAGDESNVYIEVVHKLKEIVETWQAIMLYSSAGLTTFAEIPDLKLQKHLRDEKEKYGVRNMDKMIRKLRHRGHTLQNTEMSEAQILIINQLKACMETSGMFGDRHEILVNVLLEGDGFLASPDFLSVFNCDGNALGLTNDSLPVNFRSLWKAMLNFLYQSKVIPLLMEKLIDISNSGNESRHRRKMAAIWLKELAQGLSKVKKTVELVQNWDQKGFGSRESRKVYKTQKSKSKRKLKMKLTTSHIHKEMVKKVEKCNPHLKKVMPLKIQKLPNKLTKLQLIQETIVKPSTWTKIFLPSVMELLDPPLPKDTKEKLITLVDIYTQEQHLSNEESILMDSQVYTVSNIKGKHGVIQSDCVEEMDVIDNVMKSQATCSSPAIQSHWTRYEDLEAWSKCPLGKLPWQTEGSALQFQLPCDCIWQPCKQLDNYRIAEKNLPGFFHKNINWDEVLSKRPRRNKQMHREYRYTDVVEKAFSMVSNVN